MVNKQVNVNALAIGGILAGWEIDPDWVPVVGTVIVVEFLPHTPPAVNETAFPAKTSVTVTAFHILLARAMQAGGRGLADTAQSVIAKTVGNLRDPPVSR